ncbi:hypothetical protein D6774_04820, partial [Candidatus Woesearchaeota archaeon]
MAISKEEIDKLLAKYKGQLEVELQPNRTQEEVKVIRTKEYQEFKAQYLPPQLGWYEKACKIAESLVKLAPSPKKKEQLEEAIRIAHLNITPEGVMSLSVLFPLLLSFIGVFISFAVGSLFFVIVSIITGFILYFPLFRVPIMVANAHRLKASGQMVLAIFYLVTYMRQNSNLELAIGFAADHLGGPLALDFRRVLWDVETQKYENIKESLDAYLETWKKWNMEFIEAVHLIEGSLFEGAEDRRLGMLDKALTVILEETYEKMLHYAHNLKSPITMLHMLGIILPILTLVILPLVVSFMEGIQWYHLAALYNFFLPFSVFYLGRSILASRPTGYGDTDVSESNPELAEVAKP